MKSCRPRHPKAIFDVIPSVKYSACGFTLAVDVPLLREGEVLPLPAPSPGGTRVERGGLCRSGSGSLAVPLRILFSPRRL